jgi:hypothetical protein
MSLAIGRLRTRVRLPQSRRSLADLVERVGRERLPLELNAEVGPRFSATEDVIRIRRLAVRLELRANDIDEHALARRWAQAFAAALYKSLAYLDGDTPVGIRRFASPAAYKAAATRAALTAAPASQQWPFADLWRADSPLPGVILDMLLEDPNELPAVLLELARLDILDRVTASLDELELERLVQLLSDRSAPTPTIRDAIRIAQIAAGEAVARGSTLASRRHVLHLYARSTAARKEIPRHVLHALSFFTAILEKPCLPAQLHEHPAWPRLAPTVQILVRELASLHPTQQAELRADLARAAEQLRPFVPTAIEVRDTLSQDATWIESRFAGCCLLAATFQRLGFENLFDHFEPLHASYILIRLLATLTGDSHQGPPDHGLALFCGVPSWYQLMPYRTFFETSTEDQRRQASAILAPGYTGPPGWNIFLDYAATRTAHEFGMRIRGYRRAGKAAIIRQFLQLPGRLRLTDRELLVSLEPSPVHLAIHISGEDTTVSGARWLDNRELRFVLEGL